jgi:pyruvate/2-oxoglutarate dehydrogenase complex dihydrolipoamide acyltransferase (E2) component
MKLPDTCYEKIVQNHGGEILYLPDEFSGSSALMGNFLVKEHVFVTKGTAVCEVESSKASVIIDAPCDGYLEFVRYPGEKLDSGAVLGILFKDMPPAMTGGVSALVNHVMQELDSIPVITLSQLRKSLELEITNVDLKKKQEIHTLSKGADSSSSTTLHAVVRGRKMTSGTESFSFLSIVIFEIACLLKKYPYLLSEGDLGNMIIGIAMDLDDGLKIGSIPSQFLTEIEAVERRVLELADLYFERELQREDLSGAQFVISDLSSFSVNRFSPLLPESQRGILGLSSYDEVSGTRTVSLTFDHFKLTGKQVALFLKDLKFRLESYFYDDGDGA